MAAPFPKSPPGSGRDAAGGESSIADASSAPCHSTGGASAEGSPLRAAWARLQRLQARGVSSEEADRLEDAIFHAPARNLDDAAIKARLLARYAGAADTLAARVARSLPHAVEAAREERAAPAADSLSVGALVAHIDLMRARLWQLKVELANRPVWSVADLWGRIALLEGELADQGGRPARLVHALADDLERMVHRQAGGAADG